MTEHAPILRTPEEELALLELDIGRWRPEIVEVRARQVLGRDGVVEQLQDGVLLLRRTE